MHYSLSKSKDLYSIISFVVTLHLLLILYLIFYSPITITPPKKERLVVRTINLNTKVQEKMERMEAPKNLMEEKVEEKPIPTPSNPPIQEEAIKPTLKPKTIEKQPPVKPVTKPVPKKVEVKKTPAKQTPKAKPVEKKIEPAKIDKEALEKQKKMLAIAAASIAQIDASKSKLQEVKTNLKEAPVPAIKSLQIETLEQTTSTKFTTEEANYSDELAARLKLLLKLPEMGAVHLQLTLTRDGQVKNIKITDSISLANKNYIEKELKKMRFSNFGPSFKNKQDYTFIIHLKN